MKYVSVIIDRKANATDRDFFYASRDDNIKRGDKVIIPFGNSKIPITGYIINILDEKPCNIKNIKEIIRVDKENSLNSEIIDTALWMSERYFLRKSDAINCFTAKEVESIKKTGQKEELKASEYNLKLTGEQEEAVKSINGILEKNEYKTFLLHGITGSGKTEVYIASVKKCLELNKKAIVLVPEISLTLQTIKRFEENFPQKKIEVIHSKLSKGEKYLAWKRIKRDEVSIVIGARSAIFAPFDNLGLIIVDEEHEGSYKSDMTPKYDAIEVALKRMHINKGPVILGSATPGVVSMFRAKIGYYKLLNLNRRYNNAPMPEIKIIDMKEELFHGNTTLFSDMLYREILSMKKRNKQTILFLNRRGYAPSISCTNCGETIKCPDCDISLAYHKDSNSLQCHFCGRAFRLLSICPFCKSESLKMIGVGTEKLEEITRENFKDQKVIRIDLDTIRKKKSVNKKLESFSKGKEDILVGTQIIAKGLDFENVLTCGIMLADLGLNFPDYRAAERTFSLIVQVSGRAGRRKEKGKVIVQTYKPNNYAIKYGAMNDYENFFKEELALRKMLLYPPFTDFLQLSWVGTKEEEVEKIANETVSKIKNKIVKIFNKKEEK
ncbi:MAG: primosomal protein N', partial [Clostridiales Family XIII bacterium]|nr:primosomal protein N' [Clostridiales Family XIII bacterium]